MSFVSLFVITNSGEQLRILPDRIFAEALLKLINLIDATIRLNYLLNYGNDYILCYTKTFYELFKLFDTSFTEELTCYRER